jgi:ubiquitin carboxyl-terminal hydrolase 7
MQFSKRPCSTKALTVSFGWTIDDVVMQHDAQEFLRVLLDTLEGKMRDAGGELEMGLQALFQGKMRSTIQCVGVNWATQRIESFYDISLNVKGFGNLGDAFRGEVVEERLEGANQYRTEQLGLQDAILKKEFLSFPDVLQLHLRRFEYSSATQRTCKVPDRFEFPTLLDLTEFASNTDGKPNVFELFGVLTHVGTIGGHYYAFIRTSKGPTWYKFNDATVTIEDAETAVAGNFGGKAKCFSAHLLVYIRRSEIDRIFTDVTQFPEHLAVPAAEVRESEPGVRVSILDPETLRDNAAKGIYGYAKVKIVHEVELPLATKGTELYQRVADLLQIENGTFRIWRLPWYVIPKLASWTLASVRGSSASIFVQRKPNDEKMVVSKTMQAIITKFFYPGLKNPLKFIDLFVISKDSRVRELVPPVIAALGLDPETELLCFTETKERVSQPVELDQSFFAAFINSGATLVFQVPPGQEVPLPPGKELENQTTAPSDKMYNAFEFMPQLRTGTVEAWFSEHFNTH